MKEKIYSNSKIQCYKNCRRLYELKYIHDMEYLGKNPALETGKSYHSKLEDILLKRVEDYTNTDAKIIGMARAFKKHIAPKIPAVVETEKEFKYELENGSIFRGFFDAITAQGLVVEHKTTSEEINGVYLERLENDEQVNSYMLASGKNAIYYTVIRKPTIRLKVKETDEEFAKRVEEWYDIETDNKLVLYVVRRTQAQIDEFKEELNKLTTEINNQEFYPKTPSYCTKYNKLCDYYPICNNYDENETYIMFVKKQDEEKEKKVYNFDIFN